MRYNWTSLCRHGPIRHCFLLFSWELGLPLLRQLKEELQPFVGLANINDGHKAVEINMLRGIIACLTDLSALTLNIKQTGYRTYWTSNTDNLHEDNWPPHAHLGQLCLSVRYAMLAAYPVAG